MDTLEAAWEATHNFVVRLAAAFLLTALLDCTNIFSPCPVLLRAIFFLCVVYALRPDVPDKKRTKPGVPDQNPSKQDVLDDKVTQVKTELDKLGELLDLYGARQVATELDKVEELLQRYGTWIEETATACLEAFRKIHKEQKEHLRQHNLFRTQYSGQFGFVVNILEGHRKDIAETSRAATENNISLCNVIGQYRQIIEDNQNLAHQHLHSVNATLKGQDDAISKTRKFLESRDAAVQTTLHSHMQLIEHNKKLIQEHGTSIDSVVSDHAQLVADYQTALDGLALLITANRIFSLMHEASRWETLGDSFQKVDEDNDAVGDAQRRLSEEDEKLIEGSCSSDAPPSMVDNVHELSRTFRETPADNMKAMQRKPKGNGQGVSLFSRGNSSRMVEHPEWKQDTGSGMDQMMATVVNQFKDTLQTTVEKQHAEEVKQLRKAQEDIQKLQADIGEIQKFRQGLRRLHESEKRHQRVNEISEISKNMNALSPEEARALRDEFNQIVTEFEKQQLADKATATTNTATTATATFAAATDSDAATAATITDPTEVTYPDPIPTAKPTNANEVEGALDASHHEAGVAVDGNGGHEDGAADDDEGRILGDFMGRMLAREEWPEKKKPRRKTRKMYAAQAKQRAEQQREE